MSRYTEERRCSSCSFLTSTLDGSERSASRPTRSLTPGENLRYQLERQFRGPHSRSGRGGNILCHGGNRTPVVQSVVTSCIDWGTPALYRVILEFLEGNVMVKYSELNVIIMQINQLLTSLLYNEKIRCINTIYIFIIIYDYWTLECKCWISLHKFKYNRIKYSNMTGNGVTAKLCGWEKVSRARLKSGASQRNIVSGSVFLTRVAAAVRSVRHKEG